jgi:hypothetical protein
MTVEATMRPRLVLGRPGDLEEALAEEVKRHKIGDPLAPVTILLGRSCG